MKTLTLVPYGTVEVLTEPFLDKARKFLIEKELKGEERRAYKLGVLKKAKGENSHLCEVYALLFASPEEKVVAVNRSYEPIARLTWPQAFSLLERPDTKVTSSWGGYTLGGLTGDAVWISHRDSSAEASDETECLRRIREKMNL